MTSLPAEGRNRVIMEAVTPSVDNGRFPAKRTVGDLVRVEADVFTDGHDSIACSVLVHREGPDKVAAHWIEVPMTPLVNDRWTASFRVGELGRYGFKVQGWVDHFETWRLALLKRIKVESDAAVDYLIGADLVDEAAARATGADSTWLHERARALRAANEPRHLRIHATAPMLEEIVSRFPDKRYVSESEREFTLVVDPVRARFSSWYEFFPRSTAAEPGTHGTFADCERRLPYVADLGFNVVYMPPIHAIGRKFRKGPNNNPESQPADEGSPWAIGSADGGNKSIHVSLCTRPHFRR